jgi:choline dehydrogenase-like flavoprotein
MIGDARKLDTDVVVVGSGPGGASVALDLAKQGKKVLILERGKNHKQIGTTFAALLIADRHGFLFSQEGVYVARAITTGGSSVVFCGAAVLPPAWIASKYKIDLSEFVEAARREIGIKPLPDKLIGPAATRIMEAARDLGLQWNPIDKFIDPEKCELKCPHCMLGCTQGAKWTARDYIREAVNHGATLMNQATVEEVLVENRQATGVRALTRQGRVVVNARATVLAAGGMGTPVILQRSGIYNAGKGFFADPLIVTYGLSKGPGSWRDIPMSAGTLEFASEGIVMTDLADPWAIYLLNAYWKGWRYLPRFFWYRRVLGIMTKARDELNGRVNLDGTISKPITYEERWKLDKGATIAEKILKRAGADPDSIFSTPVRAAHPGGTARIGEIVNTELETEIKNLYVCDTSIIPEPWGLPPVWTIIAFGKRLARRLGAIL